MSVRGQIHAPSALPPVKIPYYPLMVGWLGPRTGLSIWEKRKIILSARKWTILLFPAHDLVTKIAELFRAPKLRVNITNYLVSEPSRLQSNTPLP